LFEGLSPRYLHINGDLEINGGTGTALDLSFLTHLRVTGNLTLNGNINMTGMIAVNVGGNLTIGGNNANVNITGRPLQYSQQVGTYFIVGQHNSTRNMHIGGGSDITLENSRFYVPGTISWAPTRQNDTYFAGNSLFIAYGHHPTNTLIGSIRLPQNETNGVTVGRNRAGVTSAPQFYARRNINMYMQGSGPFYAGVFAALGTVNLDVRSDPGGTISLAGFVLGNEVNATRASDLRLQALGLDSEGVTGRMIDKGSLFRQFITEGSMTIAPRESEGIHIREVFAP
jgi:hypothetical protein